MSRKIKIVAGDQMTYPPECKLIYVNQTNRDRVPDNILPEKGFFFIVLVVLDEKTFQPFTIFKKFTHRKSYALYQSRIGEYVDIVEGKKKVKGD